jgi:hypothetical protein
MEEKGVGDFSPIAVTHSYNLKKGDKVAFKLEGAFGEWNPFLKANVNENMKN